MIKQKHFILLFLRQYSNKVGTYESQRKNSNGLGMANFGCVCNARMCWCSFEVHRGLLITVVLGEVSLSRQDFFGVSWFSTVTKFCSSLDSNVQVRAKF